MTEQLYTKEAFDTLTAKLAEAEAAKLAIAQRFDEFHPDPSLMARIILTSIERDCQNRTLTAALEEANERVAWLDHGFEEAKTERDELLVKLAEMEADRDEWRSKAQDAANTTEFFKGEVKLRNRIPATSDAMADMLRRAETAEAKLTAAETALATARRDAVRIIQGFHDAAYDGTLGNRPIKEEKQALLRDIIRALTTEGRGT